MYAHLNVQNGGELVKELLGRAPQLPARRPDILTLAVTDDDRHVGVQQDLLELVDGFRRWALETAPRMFVEGDEVDLGPDGMEQFYQLPGVDRSLISVCFMVWMLSGVGRAGRGLIFF